MNYLIFLNIQRLKRRLRTNDLASEMAVNHAPISRFSRNVARIPKRGKIATWDSMATP